MSEAQGWILIGGVWLVVSQVTDNDYVGLTAAISGVISVLGGLLFLIWEDR